MHRVLVLGAGKIGALISGLLADAGGYDVQLADVFVRQEQFRLPEVLANRFGAWYGHGADKSVSGRMVVEGKAGRQRSRTGALR